LCGAVNVVQQALIGGDVAFCAITVNSLALALAVAAGGTRQTACPAVGLPAANFNMPLAAGGRVSLTSLIAGKRAVVLAFWRFDCAPCAAELPILQRLDAGWGKDVTTIAIHVGGPEEKMHAFLDQRKVTLPIAVDFNKALSTSRYCADVLPRVLVLDDRGVVRAIISNEADFENAVRTVIEPLIRKDNTQPGVNP
jgi:peroxiredoxin